MLTNNTLLSLRMLLALILASLVKTSLNSALDSGLNGPGSSPGQGHCVVFLGKTLYFHSASLHQGV